MMVDVSVLHYPETVSGPQAETNVLAVEMTGIMD